MRIAYLIIPPFTQARQRGRTLWRDGCVKKLEPSEEQCVLGPIKVLLVVAAASVFLPSAIAVRTAESDGAFRVVDTLEMPSRPLALVVNPDTNRLYVSMGELYVFDVASREALATIPMSGGSAMALNRTTNTLYAVNYGGGLSVIDGETNQLTAVIDVGSEATAIAVNSVTNRIYVNEGSANISVIDGSTNTVIDHIGLLTGRMAIDATSNRLYALAPVLSIGPTKLTIIDASTNATIGQVNIGVAPFVVIPDPEIGTVFVAKGIETAAGPSELLLVDPVDRSVEKITQLDTQITTFGLDARTHTVYAVNFYTNSVTVFDSSGNVIATVPVGLGPSDIAVDEVRHLAYVTHGNENNIAVIGSSASDLPGGGGQPRTDSKSAATLLVIGLGLIALGGAILLGTRRTS